MQLSLTFTFGEEVVAPVATRRARPRAPRPAAGLLLRFTDHEGDWYLLGKRHPDLGGTWANIGGSLDDGEGALVGALREFTEELRLPATVLRGSTIAKVIEVEHDRVPYTLFVLDVPVAFDNADLSWEHTDLAWHHVDTVADLRLHHGFRAEWEALVAAP